MRPYLWLPLVVLACSALCAKENLVNTYLLDSGSEAYRLTLKDGSTFELTGPGGQQATGNYVSTDRKIGLISGQLLRHFEYQVQNGDLLLRPTNTDGPEPNSVLGQMPPVQRGEQFTAYLTESNHKQKYAVRQPLQQPVPPVSVVAQPVVAAQTLEQLLAQAQNDSQYHAYMAAGAKSFSEKRYPEARAHFIVASRLKPEAVEAKERMALCDGVTALAEGDAARQRGDWREARDAYQRAKQASPVLGAIADAQMPGSRRHGGDAQPPDVRQPIGALETGVVQHLRQGRTAEALRLSTNALQLDPTSLRLRTMREGIAGLQSSEAIHQNLSNILTRACTNCDAIQKEEPLNGRTADWNTAFTKQMQQLDQRLAATRNRYIENPYAGPDTTLTDARTSATETAKLLDLCRSYFTGKAADVAKEDDVDLPFLTIKTNRESKRVARLNSYSEGFKALSAEAAALAK
jgi:hypothetical protein